MPYSVNCAKCDKVMTLGASEPAKTCECGWTTNNSHYEYPKLYQACNLDGSRIVKKQITLADILSSESVSKAIRLPRGKKP